MLVEFLSLAQILNLRGNYYTYCTFCCSNRKAVLEALRDGSAGYFYWWTDPLYIVNTGLAHVHQNSWKERLQFVPHARL